MLGVLPLMLFLLFVVSGLVSAVDVAVAVATSCCCGVVTVRYCCC